MLIEHDELRHYWYVVAETPDVDASPAPLAVRLLGADYVVWRSSNGELVAAPDRCPHRESPLSIGTVADGCLTCAYHGWKFGDGGSCVEVPSSGVGRPVPPKAHLPTVHARERYGLVWICPGEPVADIPRMAADDDPAYRRINSGVERWSTSVTRMTDNFLDIAHFPWVHARHVRDPGQPAPFRRSNSNSSTTTSTDTGTTSRWRTPPVRSRRGSTPAVITRRMTTGFNLPFTVRSTIHYETGLDHLILLCSTPIDDVTSYFTFVIWRNDDFSVPGEEVIAFDRAIGAEDKVMLERIPGVLPLDQLATVSVQSDKPSVEWRRQLAALLGV